jgi:predicted nucleic acid-binding protein
MSRFVLLDAAPLGEMSHPDRNAAISAWADGLTKAGNVVGIPEIADYEIRRELLRAGKRRGLRRLDRLKATLYYLPISTEMMVRAAELWAQARQAGRPGAPDPALDADVILAAQARLLIEAGHEVVVATADAGHLSRFVDARRWEEIV